MIDINLYIYSRVIFIGHDYQNDTDIEKEIIIIF